MGRVTRMKDLPIKLGFLALMAFIGASAAVSTSSAETPTFLDTKKPPEVSDGKVSADINGHAQFISAATYKVEHQPMTVTTADPSKVETHIVTKEAYVTIGGLPGETVAVTCDVSRMDKDRKNVRDCGGQPSVEQRMIMSGQKLDDGVLLTDDLMPNDKGKSESTVSFEVSYP